MRNFQKAEYLRHSAPRQARAAAPLLLMAALLMPGPAALARELADRAEPTQEGTVNGEADVDTPPDGGDAGHLADLEVRMRDLEAELAAVARRQKTDPDALLELERRLEILSREIEKLQIGKAAVMADQPVHGLGPAASKIYQAGEGVSIGGYGEMLYEGFDSRKDDESPSGKTDKLDFLRAIIYLGYKFNDRILFNSEIEFEHASTGKDGEVSVEFAYLDFLFKDQINARAGLLLIPMGFINELHEPPIFLGARRPDLERRLIPSTWRENGAGVFGDLGPVSYRAYMVAGFDGAGIDESGFSASGLRGGRQSGSKSLAEDFAFVARADWEITPGLTLGGSFYTGDSGQGAVAPTTGEKIDARTEIMDVHLEWRWRGLEFRALYVTVDVDDADRLNEFQDDRDDLLTPRPLTDSIGSEMDGYYVQAGYDVFSFRETHQALIPYVRYEEFDTQSEVPSGFLRDPANDVEVITYGIAYKPIPNVVFKLDFQDFDNAAGTGTDQWNLAAGFLF